MNGVATLNCQDTLANGTAACALTLEGLPVSALEANCKSAECLRSATLNSTDMFNGTNGEFKKEGIRKNHINLCTFQYLTWCWLKISLKFALMLGCSTLFLLLFCNTFVSY